jgi:UDP-glucuronate decarboxylase
MSRAMNVEGLSGPLNLGNPAEATIMELAEKVIRLTGGRSKVEFRPLPADDPTRRRPDITLAREKLGWEPKVGLDEGLERTIAHFRELLGRAAR